MQSQQQRICVCCNTSEFRNFHRHRVRAMGGVGYIKLYQLTMSFKQLFSAHCCRSNCCDTFAYHRLIYVTSFTYTSQDSEYNLNFSSSNSSLRQYRPPTKIPSFNMWLGKLDISSINGFLYASAEVGVFIGRFSGSLQINLS